MSKVAFEFFPRWLGLSSAQICLPPAVGVGQDGIGLWHEESGIWVLHGQRCPGNSALGGPGLDSWDWGLTVG